MTGQAHLKQLAAALECDRDALDRLFEKARWLPATNMFAGFRALVERHIGAEEPAVRGLVADGLCPEHLAERIQRSHDLMRRLIDEAREAIGKDDDEGFARAFDSLVRVTAAHTPEEVLPALREPLNDPACKR